MMNINKPIKEYLDIELQKEKTKQLEILRDIKRMELEMKKKEYEFEKKNLFNLLSSDNSDTSESSESSDSLSNMSSNSSISESINSSNIKSKKINNKIKKVSNNIDLTNISIVSSNTFETLEEIEIKRNMKSAPTGNRTLIYSLEESHSIH